MYVYTRIHAGTYSNKNDARMLLCTCYQLLCAGLAVLCCPDMTAVCISCQNTRWAERSFVKAPVADLLLPEDIDRGYIVQREPQGSVLNRLQQLVQQWEAEGGESQVSLLGPPVCCHA